MFCSPFELPARDPRTILPKFERSKRMQGNQSQRCGVNVEQSTESGLVTRMAALLATIMFALALGQGAWAQGCILARSPEQGLPTGQGGFLAPGHFQVTIGERHQFSYQHYVGDVYQEYRAQQG